MKRKTVGWGGRGGSVVGSDGHRVHRRPHSYRPEAGGVPASGLEVVTV